MDHHRIAECFLQVAAIVEEQLGLVDTKERTLDSCPLVSSNSLVSSSDPPSQPHFLAVVVSAMGGKPKVTDLLLESVTAASLRDEQRVKQVLDIILSKHDDCLDALEVIPNDRRLELKHCIRKDVDDIRDILKTVSLMKWKAVRISELVSGYGETWSAQILNELLMERSKRRCTADHTVAEAVVQQQQHQQQHCFRYIDARRIITIDEDAIENGAVCWDISGEKLKQVYQEEYAKVCSLYSLDESSSSSGGGGSSSSLENSQIQMHFVITGYVASNTDGVATTLQRDGSDYSASIMGRLLESTSITIWTDVDGVLSADPRRVPDSYVLPEVSFNEAMELAYFGAKVIHPKTVRN
jgi:aspartokinase/homoserine dehydrogenase 1